MKRGSNAGTCRKCDGVDGGVNTDAQGIWETARSRVRPGKVGRGRGEDEVRKASRDLLRTGQLSCSFVSIFTWCSMTLKPVPLALPTSSTATRQNWHLSSEGLILPHSQRISKLILIFQTEHYHINRVLFVLLRYHSPSHPRNTPVATSERSLNPWPRRQLSPQQLFQDVSWMVPSFRCWHPTAELITKSGSLKWPPRGFPFFPVQLSHVLLASLVFLKLIFQTPFSSSKTHYSLQNKVHLSQTEFQSYS